MARLEGRLTSAREYRLGEGVRLDFHLTNNSDQDLYVLTWFTPLEGLLSDCLVVLRDRERIPYDGRMVKRGNPPPSAFALVRAGWTLSCPFDLSEAYEISAPGEYRVKLATEIQGIVPVVPGVDRPTGIAAVDRQAERQTLEGGETVFRVTPGPPGDKPPQTEGQRVRETERARKAAGAEGAVSADEHPREPSFIGGSADQQTIVRVAHNRAYELCEGAIASLKNDKNHLKNIGEHYLEWFDSRLRARLDEVKRNFALIRDTMKTTTFTYNLTGEGCADGVYGYTYKNSTTIWLCSEFWRTSDSGQDSKPGVIVHELSHAVAGTEDDGNYGPSNCRRLAETDPEKAIRNADTYEYYAEGLCQTPSAST